MDAVFKAKVNDSYEFEIKEVTLEQLDILKTSNSTFHILQEHKSYQAEITKANFYAKTYCVNINNAVYEVVIHNVLDIRIRDMGFTTGSTKHIYTIKAPMPGLILNISANAGETVKENAPLLVLEAMKMENSIVAPRDGIIKSIEVNVGDAVDKNQLLITFE
ncbi:acetyl-CoA carboxylase biotin carboxyl carrier protein subunit [Snuella sedimenti]|uniref:Acetyl-CoA carboxylase biotin carboxyl carrier protein subunit n=1 Tax=Snuella sedimenti TaxID=2798802 RepID=A0A8J7IY33_9FLAO|nr:acetyl-CoA carboxylase biotin carboxyl carrier protein subunit [Snuella sedimenti]MBJ6369460.1 acetyl-CoA carboxylase biotin carboxyl carrier protein subunit [Snuella sedimenti]